MKYYKRYEVASTLGSGGATIKIYKTLEEAKSFKDRKDVSIFESVYGITASGKRLRLSSKRIY